MISSNWWIDERRLVAITIGFAFVDEEGDRLAPS